VSAPAEAESETAEVVDDEEAEAEVEEAEVVDSG
jgi:hypothetical protein